MQSSLVLPEGNQQTSIFSRYIKYKCLIHSLVFSRLDYCSSALYGAPKKVIKKFDSIINYAMKIVMKKNRREGIIKELTEYGWLQAEKRIIHKIVNLVYSILTTNEPEPLAGFLVSKRPLPGTQTRSSSDTLLLQTYATSTTFGDRGFRHIGPSLWNEIPLHVRQAKTAAAFREGTVNHLLCL